MTSEAKNEIEMAFNPDVSNISERYGFQGIDIILDNSGLVQSGHVVTGLVKLDLSGPIAALGIKIKCKGEARVHFTDRSVGFRRKFAAEDDYIHKEIYLVGGESTTLEVNSGKYPFSIGIPEMVPCSFEGRYGRIRYSLKAILEITKEVEFSTSVIPFTVVSLVDLNRNHNASLPVNESQTKAIIGQSETLEMSLSLPVGGYVPGQTVPLKITFKNESKVDVAKLRIVLKKVVMYHCKEKSRKHKEIIVEMEYPISRSETTYEMDFDIPSLPPTGKIGKLFEVEYTLKVESCVNLDEWYYRMLHKNLKIRTKLVIGTVPLLNYEPIIPETADKMSLDDGMKTWAHGHKYEKSSIYRSSKPEKDDPTGADPDSDGEIQPYSPLYRVYTFNESKRQ